MQSLNLACADHYFHSIYILSGVTSSLEMIENIWKAPHRLCANTAPFYKGLENLQIFVSVGGGGSWNQPLPTPHIPRDNCISKKPPGDSDVADPLTILLKALRSEVL